jgi:hypothetical protein
MGESDLLEDVDMETLVPTIFLYITVTHFSAEYAGPIEPRLAGGGINTEHRAHG